MINPEVFARNCLQMLQQQPEYYRSFGIYWWPVKAILKHYYGRDQLYMLGDYEDPIGAAAAPRVGLQEMLGLALEEQEHNVRDCMLPEWVQTPDGVDYFIFDQDAGL